jgi:ABC-2 type transport system permease protein
MSTKANSYSQFSAFKALLKGSLRSLLKSPSAIFFSLAFPLIFIIVFGLQTNVGVSVDVLIDKTSDTSNTLFTTLKKIEALDFKTYSDSEKIKKELKNGNLSSIIKIIKTNDTAKPYTVLLTSSTASGNGAQIVKQIVSSAIQQQDIYLYPTNKTSAEIKQATVDGKEFKYLDFLLPGMLGFSILSTAIFGTAFVFFNLRNTLVLKRFFATPVKRLNIILAETSSRLVLQLLSSLIIILVGHFAFNFTLLHGVSTVLQMLIICSFGALIFMGMGFIISSVSKSEATIPAIGNSITMPQLLLSGVFMSISSFPEWMQPICKALPLSQLNTALRMIAYEGKTLLDCWQQIGILSIWGVVTYFIAIRVFKWE